MREKITTIISAFPGCGKSYYYNKSKFYYCDSWNRKVLDSDSSNFSWLKDSEGNNTKQRNPEFPQNYIDHIKENIGKADIIFVSSHKVVREALESNGIQYTLVYPEIGAKEEWLKRFKNRGDNEGFIKFISDNWDNFIKEMKQENFPNHKELEEWQYLSSPGVIFSKL